MNSPTSTTRSSTRINRVSPGVPTGGQFAASERDETPVALLDPSRDPDFDPIALAAEHTQHDLSHAGIVTITLPDGRVVAWNVNGPNMVCPACHGEPTAQANCPDCFGRGETQSVPFCDRPWDEPLPGLFIGGHQCQPAGGSCEVTDQFDVVISLAQREGFGPDPDVEHHTHTMVDGPLNPADYGRLRDLAETTADAVRRGDRVLVRCMAGMNRSGLVTAMAMIRLGWTFDQALAQMRNVRGEYVLFNDNFRAFLTDNEHLIRDGLAVCSSCRGTGAESGGPCWDCHGAGGTEAPSRA